MFNKNEKVINFLFETIEVEKLRNTIYKKIIKDIKNRIVDEYNEASDKVGFLKYQLQRRYIKILKEEFKNHRGRMYFKIEYDEIFDYYKFKL